MGYNKGKDNPNWKKGKSKKIYYCIESKCNNKISYCNYLYGNKRCQKHASQLRSSTRKGENSPVFKGQIMHEGYVYIYCPEHPEPKKDKLYVKRATLIIEKKIGRYLKFGEMVHHTNKKRTDDRPENLKLCRNQSEHNKFENRPRDPKTGKFMKTKRRNA